MDCEFDQRNTQKKVLDKKDSTIKFKERDIFFIKMWKNVRYEQNGKWPNFLRPVLILKKFNNDIFRWIALTTKWKESKYYYNFMINSKQQSAILSQIRLYDKNRLYTKIWMVNQNDYSQIKEKIKSML